MPARSPIFIKPSHSAMMPTSPMEMSKPVLAASNMALSSLGKIVRSPSARCTAAATKALRKKPSQTKFRIKSGSSACLSSASSYG